MIIVFFRFVLHICLSCFSATPVFDLKMRVLILFKIHAGGYCIIDIIVITVFTYFTLVTLKVFKLIVVTGFISIKY